MLPVARFAPGLAALLHYKLADARASRSLQSRCRLASHMPSLRASARK